MKKKGKFESLNAKDLLKLGVISIWIFIVWFLILGLQSHLLISANDGVAGYLFRINAWLKSGLDWSRCLYDSTIFGGVDLSIIGFMPIVRVFHFLGFSNVWICNLSYLFVQVLYVYLVVRASEDFAVLQGGDEPSRWVQFGLIGMFSFLPVLAWRLSYGHFALIIGLFLFLGMLSLILAEIIGRSSIVHGFIVFTAMLHTFSFSGYQTAAYSVIFGLPIVIGFLAPFRSRLKTWRTWLYPSGVGLAAFFSAAPYWFQILRYSKSFESIRSIDNKDLIYSYIVSTAWQWVTSLFWSSSVTRLDPNPFLWHEIHYALGPILLILIAALFVRSWRTGAWAIVISGFLSIALSMNLKPISTLLLNLIPALYLFRVSARSFLVVSSALTVFSGAWFLTYAPKIEPKKHILIAGIAVLFGASALFIATPPTWLIESFAWLIVFIYLLFVFKNEKNHLKIWLPILFFGLSCISVLDFKEKLLPFPDIQKIMRTQKGVQADVLKLKPELSSSLNRVVMSFFIPEFTDNSPAALGFYSLNGYLGMPNRLISIIGEIRGQKLPPGTSSYVYLPESPEGKILGQLYHITNIINYDKSGFSFIPINTDSRAHGFSQSLRPVEDLRQLVSILKANENQLALQVKNESLVLRSDFEHYLGTLTDQEKRDLSTCNPGSMDAMLTQKEEGKWIIDTNGVRGLCPYSLALSFSSEWRAQAEDGRRIHVFPAQGTLIGLLIPEGVSRIELTFQGRAPWVIDALGYLGWLWMFVICFLVFSPKVGLFFNRKSN